MSRFSSVLKITAPIILCFGSALIGSVAYSEGITACNEGNFRSNGFSYFDLRNNYQRSGENGGSAPRSIAGLLKLTPAIYRTGFLLAYESHSLQSASFEYPRLIFTGDAKVNDTIMAVSGDPVAKKPGDNSIEFLEFNQESNSYCARQITVENSGNVVFNDHPETCAGCHGSDLRPNWNGYNTWLGFFGSKSNLAVMGSIEHQSFKDITWPSIQSMEPYTLATHLSKVGESFIDSGVYFNFRPKTDGSGIIGREAAEPFGLEQSLKNTRRVARLLGETNLHSKYRFSILASLGDCEGIETFLPANVKANHPASFNDILTKTNVEMTQAWERRYVQTIKFNMDPLHDPNSGSGPSVDPHQDLTRSVSRIAKLRFIVDNRLEGQAKMTDWSMAFDRRGFEFANGNGPFPGSIADAYVDAAFVDRPDISHGYHGYDRFFQPGYYMSAEERAVVCQKLKRESLAAF